MEKLRKSLYMKTELFIPQLPVIETPLEAAFQYLFVLHANLVLKTSETGSFQENLDGTGANLLCFTYLFRHELKDKFADIIGKWAVSCYQGNMSSVASIWAMSPYSYALGLVLSSKESEDLLGFLARGINIQQSGSRYPFVYASAWACEYMSAYAIREKVRSTLEYHHFGADISLVIYLAQRGDAQSKFNLLTEIKKQHHCNERELIADILDNGGLVKYRELRPYMHAVLGRTLNSLYETYSTDIDKEQKALITKFMEYDIRDIAIRLYEHPLYKGLFNAY